MVSLELALQILTLIPPLQFGTPDAGRVTVAVEGSGVLLITGCAAGEGVAVRGSDSMTDITAAAGPDGIARITAPAQRPDADSYLITTHAGTTRIHGTLNAGETLSGVCL